VACGLTGPIVYHFKEGSNPFWTAIQIRNHRYPIAKVEYLREGSGYVEMVRETYNYFLEAAGMGEGPYTLRVTDVLGQELEDTGIPLLDNGEAPGASQLPECSGM
jgi:expansin (peptidoglycan-binding protein)